MGLMYNVETCKHFVNELDCLIARPLFDLFNFHFLCFFPFRGDLSLWCGCNTTSHQSLIGGKGVPRDHLQLSPHSWKGKHRQEQGSTQKFLQKVNFSRPDMYHL